MRRRRDPVVGRAGAGIHPLAPPSQAGCRPSCRDAARCSSRTSTSAATQVCRRARRRCPRMGSGGLTLVRTPQVPSSCIRRPRERSREPPSPPDRTCRRCPSLANRGGMSSGRQVLRGKSWRRGRRPCRHTSERSRRSQVPTHGRPTRRERDGVRRNSARPTLAGDRSPP